MVKPRTILELTIAGGEPLYGRRLTGPCYYVVIYNFREVAALLLANTGVYRGCLPISSLIVGTAQLTNWVRGDHPSNTW